MFRRVLIANRGEIACRVIATCRRMGLGTIAVFSDADAGADAGANAGAGAAHARAADSAVRIGPAPAALSYLDGGAVIDAALRSGAEAIHPGYGFLSESADFAEAVAAAGLVFIGPPPAAIRAMGLKDAAKARMAAAGVPVLPGDGGADQTHAALAGAAARLGYPVMIKARAGGGGRGMRRVDRPADFAAALDAARREAEAAFGDGAALIERCVAAPRHVEVQVFADIHGNVVHLFERDCSLQRRHQKVIEEAPAPGMTAPVRAAMTRAATEAARAVGYVGAGTVEFIAEGAEGLRADGFWFLEMNTRLQVEHPVTEAVTGIDLVEWQLRVAAGEPLPLRQEAIACRGHAVEARLYAEDPGAGFLPSPGRIAAFRAPASAAAFAPADLRLDAGVAAGDAVPAEYDPMIAKLIAHGSDRASALRRLDAGLAALEVAGPATNRAFLRRLLADRDVAAGRVETGLIGDRGEALAADPAPSPLLVAVAALAALDLPPPGPGMAARALCGFRVWGSASHLAEIEVAGEPCAVAVTIGRDGAFGVVPPEGPPMHLTVRRGATAAGPDPVWRVALSGHERAVTVDRDGPLLFLHGEGASLRARILPPPASAAEVNGTSEADGVAPGDGRLTAPIPGRVGQILVSPGAIVEAGAAILVLEAMKMEHTLRAALPGRVAALLAAEGAQVVQGALLAVVEPVAPVEPAEGA